MTRLVPSGPKNSPSPWRRRAWILLIALAAAALLLLLPLPPAKHLIRAALEWTRGLGHWGPPVFVVFYVLACIFLVSGTLMMLGAGFLFGVSGGSIAASIGGTLGAGAAFLLGRTCLRGWVDRRLAAHPKLTAVDNVLSRKALKVVFLTRLTSAPSVLVNYAFGLTRVKFWPYLLGSWLGLLPRVLLYVYLGSAARSLAELFSEERGRPTILTVYSLIGLLVTAAVLVFIGHLARRALKQGLASSPGPK